MSWTAAACALLAAAIGAYFLLTHDWTAAGNANTTAGSDKFALVQRLGLWIQARRPILALGDDVNGNVAGAALVLLLPLAITGAWQLHTQPQRRWGARRTAATLVAFCAAFALLSLLLTSSRGAWLGLFAGALIAAVLYAVARRAPGRLAFVAAVIGALGLLASFATVWSATSVPGMDLLLRAVMGSSALSRTSLWRDGLALAGDYLYTGAGLGTTPMVYSTYAMILHVGFITHAHNLFLQMALEQGLPGLLAFMALLVLAWRAVALPAPLAGASARKAGHGSPLVDGGDLRSPWNDALPWRLAAAASLTALVVHGALDAGTFGSRLAPLVFLPIGFAFAIPAPAGSRTQAQQGSVSSPVRAGRTLSLFATPVALLVLAGLFAGALLPGPRAAFQANLGALSQAQAELSVYSWPAWPIQDALRRQAPNAPSPVDLAPAVARYRAALALDPSNVTANRRLGQIELSQGDYAAARDHLAAAYAVAPGQYATRLLLGELLAIDGRTAEAAALWRGLDVRSGQLDGRAWWHGALGETDVVNRLKAAAELAKS